jgi:hypothetical protein
MALALGTVKKLRPVCSVQASERNHPAGEKYILTFPMPPKMIGHKRRSLRLVQMLWHPQFIGVPLQ